ncbi:MAG: ABC transporter permease, partial [Verrucomicrobiota bacterium]|nr:ABC transporter permease [Verrucomicrobiota bacterium]
VISFVTLEEQSPRSTAAAETLALRILGATGKDANVLILVRNGEGQQEFANTLKTTLSKSGLNVTGTIVGTPRDARAALGKQASPLAAIATDEHMATFCVEQLPQLGKSIPALEKTTVYQPKKHTWPNFLKKENLLNVLKQISVVAIIAIGMTMVIITAGIDLSVGSLIAFSGVITALSIQQLAGGADPATGHLLLGSAAGILVCALIGMGTGSLVTLFNIPAFIVTLGVMFIAKGLAFIFSQSAPIPVANEGFAWLGRGSDLMGLPNSVVLMLLLYGIAHTVMSHTSIGRYIYAVGGNPEAARLSGVPVKWVLVFVYTLCGLLAGLGGVMEASLHITGDPKSGTLVELQVIAAVVVGGTSLAGGQGKIFGTLVGALIIGVIRNGMNLTGVEAHMQSVVYGVVILIAVMVDQLKNRGLKTAH